MVKNNITIKNKLKRLKEDNSLLKKQNKELIHSIENIRKDRIENIQTQTSDYLRKIIESLPGYIYWKNKQMIYQGCNHQVAEYLGLPSCESIIGKTDHDFEWNKERIQKLHKIDCQVLAGGMSRIYEDNIPDDQGNERIMLTNKSPMYDQKGNIIGLLGVSSDITELKNSQWELMEAKKKAEIANRAKSAFIANISHDLRTPITGIMGMQQGVLSLIENIQPLFHSYMNPKRVQQRFQEVAHRSKKYMHLAQNSTQALLNIFNQILDAIQIESGKADHTPIKTFKIRSVLQNNIQLLQSLAHHKQLELSTQIDPCVPHYLSGKQSYLDRILSNLISNAIKFTHVGFVRVTISLAQDTPQPFSVGDTVTVVIRTHDSGIGIPEKEFETIFENFSRLTPAYHGVYPGSGVGLYMVKKYVEIMQGRIEVQSHAIEGTCFTLTLPFVLSEAKAMEAEDPSSPTSSDSSL